ncbi:MAG: patatin-like phospholipase family protein, partial [Vicinamibacterales bacterium]
MSKPQPIAFDQVLAGEYKALRPHSGFEGGLEKELIARMHADAEPLSALCISGGGIRSATFALGAIQGLAERGLLTRFDYLSTVSGGGYIGSWLTAWAHRAGGIDRVVPHLCRDAPAPAATGADPIQHLREYNSYLSPQGGILSTDVWTLIATVVRNILLNWMVLIPILMCALMVPRLYLAALSLPERLYGDVIYSGRQPDWAAPALDAISGSPLVALLLPALSVLLLAVALFFTLRYLPGVGGRDHSRYDFSLKVLTPLVGAVLTFLTFDSLYYVGRSYVAESHLEPVVVWTLLPCAAAWLLVLVTHRGSARERLRLLLGPLSLAIVSMAAGIGVATWAVTNFMLWNDDPRYAMSWAGYVTVGPPAVLVGFVVGTVLFVGLSSRFLNDDDREWMSRATGTILLFGVEWACVCTMVLLLPQ